MEKAAREPICEQQLLNGAVRGELVFLEGAKMAQEDSSPQGKGRKSSRGAIHSFLIPTVNLLIVVVGLLVFWVYELIWAEEEGLLMWVALFFVTVAHWGIFAMFITPVFGIVFGIGALREIRRSQGNLGGRRWAIGGISISAIMLGCMLASLIGPAVYRQIELNRRLVCVKNLRSLELAVKVYVNSDSERRYPTADKWCDLLLQGGYVTEELFICPGSAGKPGQSSYTLNKNVAGAKAPEVSAGVVLLFESGLGWNQFGGPEMLNTENHDHLEGCYVVFGDRHIEYVYGRELTQLKWKPDE
ncbi:MAG: DUF4190 domain-containing protein [Planctomycetota bacterium]